MVGDLLVAFPHLQTVLDEAGAECVDRVFPAAAFTADERAEQVAALTDTRVAQPALGIAAMAVTRLLRRLGVEPDLAAGHSYGELVALHTAGVFDAATLLGLSRARGEAMVAAAEALGDDPGAMAAVGLPADELIPRLPDGVVLANHNGPRQAVVAGPTRDIEAFTAELAADKVGAKRLDVAAAFHSPLVAQASLALADRLDDVEIGEAAIPVWSNAGAAPYPTEPDEVRLTLAAQIGQPVRFVDQIEAMYAAGARVFVEAGPGRVLTQLVDRILGDRAHLAVACETPREPGVTRLLLALAELAVAGVPVDVRPLFDGRAERLDLAALPVAAPGWRVNGHLVRTRDGEPVSGGLQPADRIPEVVMHHGGRSERASGELAGAEHREDRDQREHVGDRGVDASADVSVDVGNAARPVTSRDGAVLEYLRSMQLIVDAQRAVMLSYLGERSTAMDALLAPSPHDAARTAGGHDATVTSASPIPPLAPAMPVTALVGPDHRSATNGAGSPGVAGNGHDGGAGNGGPVAWSFDALAPGSPAAGPVAAPSPEPASSSPAGPAAATSPPELAPGPSAAGPTGGLVGASPADLASSPDAALPTMPVDAGGMLNAGFETEPPLAPATAPAVATGPPRLSGDELLATILAIVGERTGYPLDMLDPDLDLEADLSIDSIKRIEIIGELADQVGLPGVEAGADGPGIDEAVVEELAQLKTLRAIVAWIDDHADDLTPTDPTASPASYPSADHAGTTDTEHLGAPGTGQTTASTASTTGTAGRSAASAASKPGAGNQPGASAASSVGADHAGSASTVQRSLGTAGAHGAASAPGQTVAPPAGVPEAHAVDPTGAPTGPGTAPTGQAPAGGIGVADTDRPSASQGIDPTGAQHEPGMAGRGQAGASSIADTGQPSAAQGIDPTGAQHEPGSAGRGHASASGVAGTGRPGASQGIDPTGAQNGPGLAGHAPAGPAGVAGSGLPGVDRGELIEGPNAGGALGGAAGRPSPAARRTGGSGAGGAGSSTEADIEHEARVARNVAAVAAQAAARASTGPTRVAAGGAVARASAGRAERSRRAASGGEDDRAADKAGRSGRASAGGEGDRVTDRAGRSGRAASGGEENRVTDRGELVPPAARRFVLETAMLAPALPVASAAGKTFAVVSDPWDGLGELCSRLERAGATVEIVPTHRGTPDQALPPPVAALLAAVDGVVHLGAADAAHPVDARDVFAALQPAIAGRATTLVAAVASRRRAAPTPTPATATATGVPGLMRAVARELPRHHVRAVEIAADQAPAVVARLLADEVLDPAGPASVAYVDGTRTTRRVAKGTPLDSEPPKLPFDAESVVVLTGGARGITARAAIALARATGCQLELLGRSPVPADEDPRTATAPDRPSLRRALIDTGELRIPAEIEAACDRIMAAREIRATLHTLSELGVPTSYHGVDVRDGEALGRVLDEIRSRQGRIDAVVHGAGVLDDRLARDKTHPGFDRVFATKVDAAGHLLARLGDDVRLMVLFGSVSGVFGNRGQVDYSAANDALDELAVRSDGVEGRRVISIDWGPWAGVPGDIGTGMVSPELQREYARRGVGLIDPEEGVRALLTEMATLPGEPAQVVVMRAEPEALDGRPPIAPGTWTPLGVEIDECEPGDAVVAGPGRTEHITLEDLTERG